MAHLQSFVTGKFFSTLLVLALLVPARLATCQATRPAQTRILFIGNSLTYVNDLPGQMKSIAAKAYPAYPALYCESVTAGGATLERHWNAGTALKKIHEGHWDYIVLQEQSQTPILDREKMYTYAKQFDAEVKKSGAKTVLYMTWPNRARPQDLAPLSDAYTSLGKELGATVVPVGLAWREAETHDPKLPLYRSDGRHADPAGTYLAACCFLRTLAGAPGAPLPSKATSTDGKVLADIEPARAAEIQKAVETVVLHVPSSN